MTFLELVKQLRIETNYSNTGPTSVVKQSGDHERAVSWIKNAYIEIQNRMDWRWLRREFTLPTVSGTDAYAYTDATDVLAPVAISRFKSWMLKDPWNRPKCYLSSGGVGGEYWLNYLPWEHFRTIYQLGSGPGNARPAHITIDPQDRIVLGPTPDDIYVVTGEYMRGPQVLAANTDIPEMPTQYHMAIVYMAMEPSGLYNGSEAALARAQRAGRKLLRQLEATQAPPMRVAGPLA